MAKGQSEDRGARRNGRLALALVGVFFAMVGVSFAAVPLYDLFCRVTGIAGTTQVSDAAPGVVGEETITIRFNADVNQRLPWQFEPERRSMEVRIGEPNLVHYHAKNLASRPTVGTAVYNVSLQVKFTSTGPVLLLRRAEAGGRRGNGHGSQLLRRPGNSG